MNTNFVSDMTREQTRDLSRERRYCQLVTRDGKDLGHASEEFMHDYKGRGVRYHRAIRLLIWAPNSRDMLFRRFDTAWDSAVVGHVYYKEFRLEALHRLINEQLGIGKGEMTLEDVTTRTNKLFTVSPCLGTGMEFIDVYSMTLRHGEVLESKSPILPIYPRDLESRIVANTISTTQDLDMLIKTLNDKYIF